MWELLYKIYKHLPENSKDLVKRIYFFLYYKPKAFLYNQIVKYLLGQLMFEFSRTEEFIYLTKYTLNIKFTGKEEISFVGQNTMGSKIRVIKKCMDNDARYTNVLLDLLNLCADVKDLIRNPYSHAIFMLNHDSWNLLDTKAFLYKPRALVKNKSGTEEVRELSFGRLIKDIKKSART